MSDLATAIRAFEREQGVSMATLKQPCRRQHIVRARWAAFALLRERRWSLSRIAAWFGMDHTTVLYGLRRHRELTAQAQREEGVKR
jgi:chromosomal replication initiation ATPase DnaA